MKNKHILEKIDKEKMKTLPAFVNTLTKVIQYNNPTYIVRSKSYNNSNYFVCQKFHKPISKVL